MKDFSIRCATFGAGPTAPILAIAAIAFDPVSGKLGNKFYCTIELQSVLKPGVFLIDPESVSTWMGRTTEARSIFHLKPNVPRHTIATALDELNKWIWSQGSEPPHAWGDLAVLEYAYRAGAIGLQPAWHNTGRREKDSLIDACRVLFGMGELPDSKPGVLDDLRDAAELQATQVQMMYAFMAKAKAAKPAKHKPVVTEDDEI